MFGLIAVLSLAATSDQPSGQQDSALRPGPDTVVIEDVVVLARRGAALLEPEYELDSTEISALGAYDISEVIRRVMEDYALGEAPVVIVNGRRVADPHVFASFPPEALERVEILPSEAGAAYGADRASRRVVNIVLQRRYNSREARLRVRRPTAGGMTNWNVDLRQSSIVDTRTRQLGLESGAQTALSADERGRVPVDQVQRGVILRPGARRFALNFVETASLGNWAASLRAQATETTSRSTSIRNGELIESRREHHGLTWIAGLNGELAGWSTRVEMSGLLSEGSQAGLSPSDFSQQSGSAGVGISRGVVTLPAGGLIANFAARGSRSQSVTRDGQSSRRLSRVARALNGSLSVPLSRRSQSSPYDSLAGDLTVSVGGERTEGDSGRGQGVNAAVSWSPLPKLSLFGSWASSTLDLADDQRLEPSYLGDPVAVFDFRNGEAVEVQPLLGGNPDLLQPKAQRVVLTATLGPFTSWRVQGSVGLNRSEETNALGILPDPTPEIEAAFPERFQRDSEGRLIQIDRRPLNLVSAASESMSASLGALIPLQPRGQLRLSFSHAWQLRSDTTIRAGLPEMDRLAGDGGGLPSRSFLLSADGTWGSWRVNASARYKDGYRVRRDAGVDGPDDLQVKALGLVDLRLTYRLDRFRRQARQGEQRGMDVELELELTNLFDARPAAAMADGRPARGYGRYDHDPIGRAILFGIKGRF